MVMCGCHGNSKINRNRHNIMRIITEVYLSDNYTTHAWELLLETIEFQSATPLWHQSLWLPWQQPSSSSSWLWCNGAWGHRWRPDVILLEAVWIMLQAVQAPIQAITYTSPETDTSIIKEHQCSSNLHWYLQKVSQKEVQRKIWGKHHRYSSWRRVQWGQECGGGLSAKYTA